MQEIMVQNNPTKNDKAINDVTQQIKMLLKLGGVEQNPGPEQ